MFRTHPQPVAVVIGADRPVAAQVCQDLAATHHYTVVATAADARKIPQRLRRLGVERVRLDVLDESAVRRFFTEHANAYQRLDTVIYLPRPAADGHAGPLDLPGHLPGLLATNAVAPWTCLAYAARWLTEFDGHSLVLTEMDCSRMGGQAPGLQMSQAALHRYAELLAAEFSSRPGDPDGDQPVVSTVRLDPWTEQDLAGLAALAEEIVRAALGRTAGQHAADDHDPVPAGSARD